jgi:deazaflavin-dependent oxidoreductase (nitroreductase family)
MQFRATNQQQGKRRQVNWIGIILLNVFVAQMIFAVVKRLKEQSYDRRAIYKRYLNPLMLKIAGRRPFPQGIIHHVGRKSARSYATPVAVTPIDHGFVVPLPYGTDVDWCRNILASGSCTLQWQGATYSLVEPEIVTTASIISQLLPVQQVIFRILKVEYVLKMQLSTASVDYTSVAL